MVDQMIDGMWWRGPPSSSSSFITYGYIMLFIIFYMVIYFWFSPISYIGPRREEICQFSRRCLGVAWFKSRGKMQMDLFRLEILRLGMRMMWFRLGHVWAIQFGWILVWPGSFQILPRTSRKRERDSGIVSSFLFRPWVQIWKMLVLSKGYPLCDKKC